MTNKPLPPSDIDITEFFGPEVILAFFPFDVHGPTLLSIGRTFTDEAIVSALNPQLRQDRSLKVANVRYDAITNAIKDFTPRKDEEDNDTRVRQYFEDRAANKARGPERWNGVLRSRPREDQK